MEMGMHVYIYVVVTVVLYCIACVCVCDAVRGQGGVRDEPQGLELPSGH
jgi:hypothetical protein